MTTLFSHTWTNLFSLWRVFLYNVSLIQTSLILWILLWVTTHFYEKKTKQTNNKATRKKQIPKIRKPFKASEELNSVHVNFATVILLCHWMRPLDATSKFFMFWCCISFCLNFLKLLYLNRSEHNRLLRLHSTFGFQ